MTGTMCVLDATGDTKTIWDSDNPDEVAAARTQFGELIKKGYRAFRVNKDGDKGAIMSEFDPGAEKMILTPPLRGG